METPAPVFECPHGCGRTFERPQARGAHAARCKLNPSPTARWGPRPKAAGDPARRPKRQQTGAGRAAAHEDAGSPVALVRGMFAEALAVMVEASALVEEIVTGYEAFLEQGRKLAVAYAKRSVQVKRLRAKAKLVRLFAAPVPAEGDESEEPAAE